MTKPFRPCPRDFRETYIRIGWDGIAAHYRANLRCVARWIEECGGDDLRRERSQVTGHRLHHDRQSAIYKRAPATPITQAGLWLHAFGARYRLLLREDQARQFVDTRVSAQSCLDLICSALTNGGIALVNRELVTVCEERARRLVVTHLSHLPLAALREIARSAVDCATIGPPPLSDTGATP